MSPFRSMLLLALLGCAACAGGSEAPPAAPELPAARVRVQQVSRRVTPLVEEVTGTIRATRTARLEAKVAGRIEAIRAVPGQAVREGQVVVRLGLAEYRAQLDRALALQQQAEIDLARYRTLFDRGAATRAELDAAESEARIAAAAADEARAMLGHSEIAAPFSGIVTRKLAELGDLAVPGKPLVEIEDPTAFRVEADISETLIGRIEIGQELEVIVPTLLEPLRGTVTEIAPAADSESRTSVVKADLPQTPGLRGGAFARVRISVAESDSLRVPAAAVVERGQLELVFVDRQGRAELRLVRTGRTHGDEVELLSGLSGGERIVVSGAAGLRDGQPLSIEP